MGRPLFTVLLLSAAALIQGLPASPAAKAHLAQDISDWLKTQVPAATQLLRDNINPAGTVEGIVVASPSRQAPDYFFHWQRDAALVMDVVNRLYKEAIQKGNRNDIQLWEVLLFQYNNRCRSNQEVSKTCPTGSGFGEPKYFVDGRCFDGPWGRPQNDGPALEASTLTRFVDNYLSLRNGSLAVVQREFYDSRLPTQTSVKANLEYVGHHWRADNIDLWEETRGQHFYTLMVQRKSMIDGAAFARKFNDAGAATFYQQQVAEIERRLDTFWDGNLVQITFPKGQKDKHSGIDVAVVLAVLHAEDDSNVSNAKWTVTDDKVLATAKHINDAFNFYQINRRKQDAQGRPLANGIGRYPEDVYDGNGFAGGNPWFLATHGMAELLYRASAAYNKAGSVKVTGVSRAFFNWVTQGQLNKEGVFGKGTPEFDTVIKSFIETAEAYMRRSHFHAGSQHFAEQFNRDSGFQQGARDLTWSYASLLSANFARAAVQLL